MRLPTLILAFLLLLAACAPPTPEVISGPAGSAPTPDAEQLAAFQEKLRQAAAARDFQALQGLMDDPFIIAYWQGVELPELSPQDATGQLRSILMAKGPITFPEPDAPLTDMLGGREPLSLWRPEDRVIAVLFSQGWEQSGLAEAMLFIAQTEEGDFVWKGVLVAPTGFERTM